MTSSRDLNDLDVLELAAVGSHRPGSGTSVLAGAGHPAETWMVSEHEYCHVELNVVTSFGCLLLVAGARATGRLAAAAAAPHPAPTLEQLVGYCRTAHEVFATCVGAWRTCHDPDEAIRRYPGYAGYLDRGRSLAGQFADGTLPAALIVTGACQAVMSPAVPDLLAPLPDLPPALAPDDRLALLLDHPLDFRWLHDELDSALLATRMVDCLEGIRDLEPAFYSGLVSRIYGQCAAVLRQHGSATQPEHAHMRDPRVVDVLVASPEGRAFVGAGDDGPSGVDWRLSLADGERWSGPLAGSAAFVGRLEDVSRTGDSAWQLDHFVWPVAELSHVLLVVRPVDVVVEQYAFTPAGEAMLRALALGGVVIAARRVVRADETYTIIGALRAPAELERLASVQADLGLIASVSESCLAPEALSSEWLEALSRLTYLSFLGDRPRSDWVGRLRAEGVQHVRYGVAEFEREGELVPTTALVVSSVGAVYRTAVFGSPNLSLALRQALESADGLHAAYDHDLAVESREMQALLTRLADDEPWFAARSP